MNNRPVVRFDGAQYLDAGDVLDLGTNDMQIFAVIRTANSDDYNYFLSKSYPGSVPYRFGLSTHGGFPRMLFVVQGNTQLPVVGTSIVSDNTPYILEFSCDRDSSLDLRVNGMLESTRDISAYASNDFQIDVPFRIGGYTESDKISLRIPYTGDIAEIIIYHRILSTEERESVEQYLGNKWLGWSDTIQIYSNHLIADEIIERDFMEGGSLYFNSNLDGVHQDAYVEPQIPVNNFTNGFTIEWWMYRDSGHRWINNIFSSNSSSGLFLNFGGQLSYIGTNPYSTNGQLIMYFNTDGTLIQRTVTFPNYALKSWHHVAITYDNTTFKGYLDGVEFYTEERPGTLATGTSKMRIGYYTTYWYEGYLSEVRIWDYARTAEEINQNMKIRMTGTEPGLRFYMPMNDKGDVVQEMVSGNNGIRTNTLWADKTPPIPTHMLTRNHELITSEFIEGDYDSSFNIVRNGIHSCDVREHYPTDIVTDGLVLWLDGDDFSNVPQTTKWVDRSGMGNHAIAHDFLYTALSGSNGYDTLVFDGNSYLTIPHNPSLNTTDVTFEVRLSIKSHSGPRTILCKRTETTNGFFIYSDGGVITFDWGGSGTNRWASTSPGFNKEITITLTRDSSGRKLFFDGVLVSSTTNSGNPSLVPTSSDLFIGMNSIYWPEGNTYRYYLLADMRYIRMYNRALSGEEILKNYNASG